MLTSQPIIEATQCVHPLIQMLSKNDRFVPNMVSCGGRDTRMKIFTGPNACGKSVYMKQVTFFLLNFPIYFRLEYSPFLLILEVLSRHNVPQLVLLTAL